MRYSGRHFVRQRIWRLGAHMEIDVYPVFQAPGQRRKRCRPTREAQRLINQRDAANKARRLILANFSDPGSMEVDLTFGRPALEAEATEALKKYIRALRKAYAGNGAVLRYMYAKEQGHRGGKWHFHLMLSPGISRERAEELWTEGFANSRRLRIDETGLAGLAEYVLKEGKKRKPEDKGKRRWSCSRNLIRPEPEVTDGEVTVSEVWDLADAIERRDAEFAAREMAPEMTLVEAEAVRNLRNGGLYIHLRLAAPECWHGRRPIARYHSGETGEDYATEKTETGGAA